MKLTQNELTLFRNILLSKRAWRYTDLPGSTKIWEPWMQGTLDKITDELYPQEFDRV